MHDCLYADYYVSGQSDDARNSLDDDDGVGVCVLWSMNCKLLTT